MAAFNLTTRRLLVLVLLPIESYDWIERPKERKKAMEQKQKI